MIATTQDLNTRLDALVLDGDIVREQIKASAASERKFYATAYVWWRDAQTVAGYLKKTYDAHGVKFNATKNRINWRPLLNLFAKEWITKTDLDIWSKVLAVIHNEFDTDPAHFAHDPVGQIDYYIKSHGGKTGVAGYHKKSQTQDDDQDDEGGGDSSKIKALLYTLDDDEFHTVFLQEAKQFYSSAPGHPLPPNTPAHFTADNFGVGILREDANGAVMVAPCNLRKLVKKILIENYRDDFSALAPTIRYVLEPLHIANVPRSLTTGIDRFTEYYKNKTGKSTKRLVYRPSSGDLLLSLTNVPASVCIISKSITPMIHHALGDILLPAFLRRSVDVRLLHQRMFNMFTASAIDSIPATPRSSISTCALPLSPKQSLIKHLHDKGISEAKALAYIENVRHPTLTFVPFPANTAAARQAQPDLSNFTATWNATVTHDWLRNAVAHFFDEWIFKYALKSNRLLNRTFSVILDTDGILLSYEFGKELGHVTHRDLPFDVGAASGAASLLMRSTDFSFVLCQLSQLPLEGTIALSANKDAFAIECRTSIASYSIYIPACNEDGLRSAQCFKHYGPVVTNSVDDPYSDEDEGSPL